ncbi:MAG TPA: hypothetical protein VE995_02455, partial [Gaiellaceae bacterium]|nr:hypothetical protein [Gaiellaceae bacterium]
MEDLREPAAQARPVGRTRRPMVQHEPEEARRLIERVLLRRLLGGLLGDPSGALGLARSHPVHRDRLAVRVRCALEGAREAFVVLAQRSFGQEPDDRLADPVVRRLDDLPTLAHVGSYEARVREQGDDLVRTRTALRGERHDFDRQGTPAYGDDLGKPASVLGEAVEPLGHELLERCDAERPTGGYAPSVAANELLDEKGAAARLARRGPCHPLDERVRLAAQCRREALGVRAVERPDGEVTHFGPVGPALAHRAQEGALARFRIAVRHRQEQRGRVRRAQELEQQARAVDVAPLRIVDEEHERSRLRERGQELAEGRERAAANARRLDVSDVSDVADGTDSPQHREDVRQRVEPRRQHERPFGLDELHQMPAERVDHTVDGLVRDGFLLVRPSCQDHGPVVLHETVEEVLDQGGLAHTWASADANGDLGTAAACLERAFERVQLRLAPDEVGTRVERWRKRRRARARCRSKPSQDFSGSRPTLRLHVEQRQAEGFELRRNARCEGRRRWRRPGELRVEDLDGGTGEGQAAGQRFVEDDADA